MGQLSDCLETKVQRIIAAIERCRMTNRNKISTLTEFQQNPAEHLKRLKETGEAEVLTVDGQAELVVQSAQAYEKLLEALDYAETVARLREDIAAADAGTDGALPLDEAMAEIRRDLGWE
jgi:PHD/YefM family antitoxin component YafN of YafNO toxin-antitoxin module